MMIHRELGTMALALFLSAAGADADSRPLFPHPLNPTNSVSQPAGVATADFDHDGNLDLVVGGGSSGVSVLLGTGGGSFAPAVPYDTDGSSEYPTIGDFDEDGFPDIAVGTWGGTPDDRVSVLLGNGDGSFVVDSVFGFLSFYSPRVTVVADFDEDGHQDLLVRGAGVSGPALLFSGRGDGTFEPPGTAAGPGICLVGADFDGDGHQDYATELEVHLGQGDGTFSLGDQLSHGDSPVWVASGDLDGDDIPDLVTANNQSSDVSVQIGNGDGTFAPEMRFPAGIFPEYVVIHDLDRDGLQDLLVSACANDGGCVAFLKGTGGGQFAPPEDANNRLQGGTAIGDFDGDGLDDQAHTNRALGDVGIVFGDGDGTFDDNPTFLAAEDPVAVAVGDFDGDGRQDLVTANETTNDVSVLLANGAGTFDPAVPYPVGSGPTWIDVAELNGDSRLDLAVANGTAPGSVSLLSGVGDGSFTLLGSLALGPGASPSFVTAADLDGDLDDDLVIANAGADNLWIYPGDGAGNFGPQSSVTVGSAPSWVAVQDLDGDDVPDLAVANTGSDNVSLLLGVGDGTFVTSQTLILSGDARPTAVVVRDLDEDGTPDLAVACPGTDKIHVYSGNGDGTFPFFFPQTISIDYGSASSRASLVAVDLDGDGSLDLATPAADSRVAVFLGHGDGSFEPAGLFHGYAVHAVAAGEFDLDGRADLVSVWDDWDRGSILLNRSGPAALSILDDRSTLVWPAALGALSYDVYRGNLSELVDLDSDGLPDSGYGVCMTALDDDARDTFFVDTEIPSPEGAGFFYLIGIIDAEGDRGLGTTSAGLERQPASPCP